MSKPMGTDGFPTQRVKYLSWIIRLRRPGRNRGNSNWRKCRRNGRTKHRDSSSRTASSSVQAIIKNKFEFWKKIAREKVKRPWWMERGGCRRFLRRCAALGSAVTMHTMSESQALRRGKGCWAGQDTGQRPSHRHPLGWGNRLWRKCRITDRITFSSVSSLYTTSNNYEKKKKKFKRRPCPVKHSFLEIQRNRKEKKRRVYADAVAGDTRRLQLSTGHFRPHCPSIHDARLRVQRQRPAADGRPSLLPAGLRGRPRGPQASFLLQPIALENFSNDGSSHLLAFPRDDSIHCARNKLYHFKSSFS